MMTARTLRSQQVLLVGIAALAAAGFGAAYGMLAASRARLERAFQRDLSALTELPRLRDGLRRIDQATDEYLLSGDATWLAERRKALSDVRGVESRLSDLLAGAQERASLDGLDGQLALHLSRQEGWLARKRAGRLPSADAGMIVSRRPTLEDVLTPVLALKDASVRELETRRLAAEEAARRTLLILLLTGTAACALLALMLTRFWVRPITALERGARAWQLGRPWDAPPSESSVEISSLGLTMRDMAERLNAQHRRMLELGKFKTRLLSLLSHEVSNALTSIQGVSAILEETEGLSQPEKRTNCYRLLKGNVRTLSLTVHNLMKMAQLEAGRFVLSPRKVQLEDLLREGLARLDILRLRKGLDASLEVAPATPPANADPEALAVVIANLLSNAFKYTPEGGRITVKAAPAPGARVRVAVKDTGIGVAPEQKAKILEGFFRTEEGKTAAEGFGVGLSLARQILEAHHSALELESEPGKGSTFSFLLPAWSEGAADPGFLKHPLPTGES